MPPIEEEEYKKHIASMLADGFALDPPGYERLSQWTHLLLHVINARSCFGRVRDYAVHQNDLDNVLSHQAYFVAAIMAYGRCYASSGPGIPSLDAKQVYKGSTDGMDAHHRLISLRNTVAAHTDASDLVRLTLGVKDLGDHIVVRHLSTSAIPGMKSKTSWRR